MRAALICTFEGWNLFDQSDPWLEATLGSFEEKTRGIAWCSAPLATRPGSALSHRPRVLVLDEPTAALTQPEWLFQEVERAAAAGTTVLYITHRLAEVRRFCDRATVLRNGVNIGTVGLADTGDDDLFRMMVGDTPAKHAARAAGLPDASPAVRVGDLSGAAIEGIDFELRRGEILGVAALEGQGF